MVLAAGLYLVATTSVQAVHVVGSSMYPTLDSGDLLIASKIDYRLHPPERGDIVILKDPMDSSRDFIKRVIGLPGDRVLIRTGRVLINGVPLDEPYLAPGWRGTWQTTEAPEGSVVPPNNYFVLGDNRDHSSDSRLFGWVSRDQIDGKAIARFWPAQKAEVLSLKPTFAKEP
ncbi:MAG TPA: signal peptidase I [Candidatus Acidoferrales bacterium]|nr:signal peptidase I [Candidatus Acidoferrales bacterium]